MKRKHLLGVFRSEHEAEEYGATYYTEDETRVLLTPSGGAYLLEVLVTEEETQPEEESTEE